MNGIQENRHTRSTVLVTFYTKFRTELEAHAALNEYFSLLISIHKEVSQNNQIILGGRKARTLAKTSARNEMATPAVALAGALFSLGRDIKDFDLQTRAGISESNLRRGYRDTEVSDVIGGLISAARQNIAKLSRNMITPDFLNSLEDKLETYKKLSGKKSTESNVFKITSDQIDKLQSQIAEIIHKSIDKSMFYFKLNNAEMYNEYLLAKRLPKEGIRHRKNNEEPKKDDNPDLTEPEGE